MAAGAGRGCAAGHAASAGDEHLRGRSPVADRGMRPDSVVVPPPTLDDDLGLAQRVEDLAIEKLVAQSRIDGMDGPSTGHLCAIQWAGPTGAIPCGSTLSVSTSPSTSSRSTLPILRMPLTDRYIQSALLCLAQ